MRPAPAAVLTLAVILALLPPTVPAALALDCQAAGEREVARLGITADEVRTVLYVEKYNPTDRGPTVLGVRAWVRLNACTSGYLVIDMTRSCFVRQSYTRGDCHLDNVTAY